jgi:uncharacterized protein
MRSSEQIRLTEEFVKQRLTGYDSGHDWWHIERVRNLAKYINGNEHIADPFILEITALLHDTSDSKFAGENFEDGYNVLGEFLDYIDLAMIKNRVTEVIRNVSFSKRSSGTKLNDPVLLIVQDADRLDAIGAVGVARAFNYGGFRNNTIFSPTGEKVTPSTINHFYEKLLLLKGLMNTETAKTLAEERHAFLESFLRQFYREWNFGMSGRNS